MGMAHGPGRQAAMQAVVAAALSHGSIFRDVKIDSKKKMSKKKIESKDSKKVKLLDVVWYIPGGNSSIAILRRQRIHEREADFTTARRTNTSTPCPPSAPDPSPHNEFSADYKASEYGQVAVNQASTYNVVSACSSVGGKRSRSDSDTGSQCSDGVSYLGTRILPLSQNYSHGLLADSTSSPAHPVMCSDEFLSTVNSTMQACRRELDSFSVTIEKQGGNFG